MAFKKILCSSINNAALSQKNIYDAMLSAFLEAGWVNVKDINYQSIKATTGSGSITHANYYDALYSQGESGKDAIYIALFPSYTPDTYTYNNYTRTNPNKQMAICLAEGVNGNIGNTTYTSCLQRYSTRVICGLSPNSVTVATTVTNIEMIYDVNKDRGIFIFRYPSSVYGSNPPCSFLYIGLPNNQKGTLYAKYEALIASSYCASFSVNGQILVKNHPAGMNDIANNSHLTRNTYLALPPINPNNAQHYWLSPIYYGSATDGYRGTLEGLYALDSALLIDGDRVEIAGKMYEVAKIGPIANYTAITTQFIAYELDLQTT